ncbi:MAG: hypothetical protein AB7J28_15445 [Hyphomonadaceae bacterium]
MVKRKYKCSCGFAWEVLCDKRDPAPDCPECAVVGERDPEAERAADEARLARMLESGTPPAVLTHKSRAIDYTQKMAEESMGLTNMRDNSRPGDAAFMPESGPTTAEVDREVQKIAELARETAAAASAPVPDAVRQVWGPQAQASQFWMNGAGIGAPSPAPGANVQMTAPAAAAARADGSDPVGLLHEAGKAGKLGPQYEVVARAKMSPETNL